MPREHWLAYTPENVFNGHYPDTVHSILDIGCGLSIKSQFVDARVRVALDIHRPYLERGRQQAQQSTRDDIVYLNASALDIDRLFLEKSFDICMVMDCIEHFYEDDADLLLWKCERIARKAVIVETPRGHIHQNIDILGMGGDHWQTHRSGWYEDDFIERGYHVEQRPYTMMDVQRHTSERQDPNITMLFAIKRLE